MCGCAVCGLAFCTGFTGEGTVHELALQFGNSGSKLEPQERDEHFLDPFIVDVEDTAESWGK